MQRDIPESDWQTLSRLKPLTLERLCQRFLREAGDIIAHTRVGGNHSAYLALYRHIQESDETVSKCFDDWRRSQALNILSNWRLENLLTEEEFAAFSAGTRAVVGGLLSL